MDEQLKQINNLVLWYKSNHDGKIPTPEWIFNTMEKGHPALEAETDPGEQVLDPDWWYNLGTLQTARAKQLEEILNSRKEDPERDKEA